MGWKEPVKRLLRWLPFDLTRNMGYDRMTRQIIARHCRPDSTTIDIGCHKGEIMDVLLHYAPQGMHYGFEPLPDLYAKLLQKYQGNKHCQILDIALSDQEGEASFNHVISNPSYSGLRKRDYDRPKETDTTITVKTRRLDDVLPPDQKVDLIKLDVEGAELMVLSGAMSILRRDKPVVIFEYGLGASDIYNATPEKLFELFTHCGMGIYLTDTYLSGKSCLTLTQLKEQYNKRINYYFVAAALPAKK